MGAPRLQLLPSSLPYWIGEENGLCGHSMKILLYYGESPFLDKQQQIGFIWTTNTIQITVEGRTLELFTR